MKYRKEKSGIVLRLYVAGQLPGSTDAEAMLRLICTDTRSGGPSLEVVDVLREPERALAEGIIVTPTLVRVSPTPQVRILGFVSDPARVRSMLGIGTEQEGHDE